MKKLVAGLTWLLSTTSLSELTHTHLGTELIQNTLLIVFIQVYTSVENAPEIHYTLQSSSCGSNHSTGTQKQLQQIQWNCAYIHNFSTTGSTNVKLLNVNI